MKSSPSDTLLISALIERLGGARSQELLDQIQKGLSQHDRVQPFDPNERKRATRGIHRFSENIPSRM